MDRTKLLEQLKRALMVEVERAPALPEGNLGLVVVDAVRGFTRTGSLSDPGSMAPMVQELDQLIRALDRTLGERLHLLVLRDRHHADIPEPPYPPHCIVGSGEEELDPELAWLERHERVTLVDKDCINGFVGAMRPAGGGLYRNLLTEWVLRNDLRALVLVGDCTDICVSDLTVALLSARNHGLLTRVSPDDRQAYVEAITSMAIFVYVPGCATFDLDPEDPGELPADRLTLRHPGPVAHHVGLWLMASRGARLIDGFAPLRQGEISA
jgi:nicotinamidase-related amidase